MNIHNGEDQLSVEELRALIPQLQEITEQYKKKQRAQDVLLNISEIASSCDEIEQLFPKLHQQINTLINAENLMVAMYQESTQQLEFVYVVDQFYENKPVKVAAEDRERTLTWQVIKRNEPVYLCQEELAQTLKDLGIYDSLIGVAPIDWMGVPLIDNGAVIGALVVQCYDDLNRYSREDLDLLNFVSQHTVHAISKVQRTELIEQSIENWTEQLQLSCRELQDEIDERERIELLQQALFEISELSADNGSDNEAFYQQLHDILRRVIHLPKCYVATLDRQQSALAFEYSSSSEVTQQRDLNSQIADYVIRKGSALMLDKHSLFTLCSDGHLDKAVYRQYHASFNHCLAIPLIIEGAVSGCVVAQCDTEQKQYNEQDLEALRYVSHHIATAIDRRRANHALKNYNRQLEQVVEKRTEAIKRINTDLQKQIANNKRIEKQLMHEATHDALTDLPNRAIFKKQLVTVLDKKKRFPAENKALLFIDLDGFKQINDSYGHQVGDDFLIEASRRIRDCIRSYDILARLGGDEFIVLLDQYDQLDDVFEICDRILQNIAEPYRITDRQIFSGASIGIVEVTAEYDTPEQIITDADAAMYEAKSRGRGVYALFCDNIKASLDNNMTVEQQFKQALNKDQLFAHVLPIIDPQSQQQIKSVHLHWNYAGQDMNYSSIQDVAKRSGTFQRLDVQVIELAIQIYKLSSAKCKISLPLSTINLKNQLLVDQVVQRVAEENIDNSRIIIEISEHDFKLQDDDLLAAMERLTDYGFQFMLSGFSESSGALLNIQAFPFSLVRFSSSCFKHLKNTPVEVTHHLIKMVHLMGKTPILVSPLTSTPDWLQDVPYLLQQTTVPEQLLTSE